MATFRRKTITLLDQCRSINVCHYLSIRTIEGALLISRCCFVSPSFSGFPCTWLRRSVVKSFKKISFHAYKNERMGLIRRRGNGGKNKRERFLIVCLHERICERACGNGGNFSFSARECSFLHIVSRANTADEGGADQSRFLDRIPAHVARTSINRFELQLVPRLSLSLSLSPSLANFGQSPILWWTLVLE